jgi:hypothetical protein
MSRLHWQLHAVRNAVTVRSHPFFSCPRETGWPGNLRELPLSDTDGVTVSTKRAWRRTPLGGDEELATTVWGIEPAINLAGLR